MSLYIQQIEDGAHPEEILDTMPKDEYRELFELLDHDPYSKETRHIISYIPGHMFAGLVEFGSKELIELYFETTEAILLHAIITAKYAPQHLVTVCSTLEHLGRRDATQVLGVVICNTSNDKAVKICRKIFKMMNIKSPLFSHADSYIEYLSTVSEDDLHAKIMEGYKFPLELIDDAVVRQFSTKEDIDRLVDSVCNK